MGHALAWSDSRAGWSLSMRWAYDRGRVIQRKTGSPGPGHGDAHF